MLHLCVCIYVCFEHKPPRNLWHLRLNIYIVSLLCNLHDVHCLGVGSSMNLRYVHTFQGTLNQPDTISCHQLCDLLESLPYKRKCLITFFLLFVIKYLKITGKKVENGVNAINWAKRSQFDADLRKFSSKNNCCPSGRSLGYCGVSWIFLK